MKVGIISKEAHAKSHAAALEAAGFTPVMLGSNPSEIPPTVPLLVCRTLSCAHGGMDTALAWSRAGRGTLIVDNGVKTILAKAEQAREGLLPSAPADHSVSPSPALYEDILKAAEAIVGDHPDSTRENLGSALSRLYPHEEMGLLRAVVGAVLPVPPEPEATAQTMPLQSTNKRPYPARFKRKLSESALDLRMEAAWNVRETMSPEDVSQFNNWVRNGCMGETPSAFTPLTGNPVAVSGLVLLCADGHPVTRPQIARAYKAAYGREHQNIMSEMAAWWLDVELTYVQNLPPTQKPTPLPMPKSDPVNNNTPNAEMLATVRALSESLDALTAKVNALGANVEGLRDRVELVAASTAAATVAGDTLVSLAAKGLEVVVRNPSR